jgi:pyridinium-3,5-biscarboxylic acid mononucleotide sulfurtransferase
MPPSHSDTHARVDRLLAAIASQPADSTAAVAFSGGTDSAFLLAAAARALGSPRVVAVTAVSPSLAPVELAKARDFAADLGVRHLTPRSDELSRPGYAENSPARCFHCKTEVIDVVHRAAAEMAGTVVVMTGTNADDLRELHRPGIVAARRLGAVTPLAELTKAEVRQVSREWGLVTWDTPAQACLASRVAYGVTVTADALLRVQRAEAALRVEFAARGWQIANLRVRDLGDDLARVEVDAQWAATAAADPATVATVIGCGFADAAVDPRGFRSGSMNEVLTLGPVQPSPR